MTTTGSSAAERLPTLTEVIELSQTRPQLQAGVATDRPAAGIERRAVSRAVTVERRIAEDSLAAGWPPIAEEQLVSRVMEELQRQIDLMLEYRLREALAPVLARAADNMVREIRTELASTLRDVVARAVAQEVARHRGR